MVHSFVSLARRQYVAAGRLPSFSLNSCIKVSDRPDLLKSAAQMHRRPLPKIYYIYQLLVLTYINYDSHFWKKCKDFQTISNM